MPADQLDSAVERALPGLRARIEDERTRKPNIRVPERWTRLDAWISMMFVEEEATREAFRARYAPATLLRYGRHCVRTLEACGPPPTWTFEGLLAAVHDQVERSTADYPDAAARVRAGSPRMRPGASVAQLICALKFLCFELAPHVAPTWFRDTNADRSWRGFEKVAQRVGFGAQRDTPQRYTPTVDFDAVVRRCRTELANEVGVHIDAMTAADAERAWSSMDLVRAHQWALVLCAMTNPTRGGELGGMLVLQNGFFATSLAAPRRRLLDVLLDERVRGTELASAQFVISFVVTGTKGDRKTKGIHKHFIHHPSIGASPGMALFTLARRRVDLAGREIVMRHRDGGARLFAFASTTRPLHHWLQTRGVTNILKAVAKMVCGIDGAGATAWRSSAVVWLRGHGVELEEIQQRGGWTRLETVLDSYMRQRQPPVDLLQRLYTSTVRDNCPS